ncbi:MAG: hypothetical protein JWM98_2572, partial [Thermoleophilia bacterium]|nr:hypothetical protein [Thermoleophilia bacterium]
MSDRHPDPRRRRRIIVSIAAVVVILSLLAGGAVALIAHRNAPKDSHLDKQLDGVTQPSKADDPTPVKPAPPKPYVEGPCWPVYGRTAGRTSDGSSLRHGIPKTRTWQVRIGLMEFPPAFCDGVIYVNNQRGQTWAVNATTKRLLWKQQTAQQFDSTPAVSGQRVFIGSYTPGTVQALDRATGRRLWKLDAGGPVESSPVVVGGLVYASSKDRRVYALDEATGKVRWAFLTGGEVKDSPSVVGGLVYVANYAGEVFALNARTGAVAWRKTFG